MKKLNQEIIDAYELLLDIDSVKKGLEYIERTQEDTLEEQIRLTEIPAPTFHEEVRGEYFQNKFLELGLQDVKRDRVGNIIGLRPGKSDGPTLVVSAHLDTVFPEGTEIKVSKKNGKVYAPGISDDGRGLAALLTLINTMQKLEFETIGDLLFVATVGEEGLGDLRGVKGLFEDREDLDGFISIEPGSPSRIIYLATGSRRYRVTYKGTGGHSFGDFGTPSAIHALGRAVSLISDLQVPAEPKTTFNIGKISGGTSVNTIAQESTMIIDIRSTEPDSLLKIESKILEALNEAVYAENNRWGKEVIEIDIELVGDRPAGSQPDDSTIVQVSLASTKAIGQPPELLGPISTDSNVPISLGIPAVTLGGGGEYGGVHTLEEWFDPTNAHLGVQQILLTILGLVGVNHVTRPLLDKISRT
ncbi:acetylornithine deacetylase/succinyl-diaminopimelate desuccinylase-like protein [Bacillus mesophilus]|uniref:M20/M25/M40 family metallo-hydrolase n=1 Tax=Bacillus mesophilus TaxID=1808955 RepID=A0A6M0Q855_9BACI|nr:M20/M25/M40 family metallo-hydrolase [Bacillus mesophilus]MBM7662106.1 acetylornithine deacetylase/succinyl-diaminopimelate desuccinylase-like protein [Bacillus mesophilus]NEY72541.1 M20/M25/M40 family metallo-hydrolase [Bacillus mesophilus]